MAAPRIFVSSTFYDLKFIRENIKYFIKNLGYEPVLSEEGSIYFDPKQHVQDACISEVPNCQIFVLIIGGRAGSSYKNNGHSITNAEYREAIRLKIPVFALVEDSTYHDYYLFLNNQGNPEVEATKISYPSADDPQIFEFIHEVRSHAVNNALVPFQDFSDIESYLTQQWAGMMFSYLVQDNEEKRVSDMISAIADVNVRVEMLSKQILRSVGTVDAKIDAQLYENMLASESIGDLTFWDAKPTPASIFLNSSFRSCAKSFGIDLKIGEDDEDEPGSSSITSDGSLSRNRFVKNSNQYKKLRQNMIDILKEYELTPEEYLSK